MALIDPVEVAASQRREAAETAAVALASGRVCPVCGETMEPCLSLGMEARFCATHNICLPEYPE